MNPSSISIALRARSLLETCDLAVGFVRRGWRAYLTLSLCLLFVPGLGLYAVQRTLELNWWYAWGAVLVWAVAVQGVFTLVGAELLFSPRVESSSVLRRFLRRFGTYLGVMLVSRLVLAFWLATVAGAPRGYARAALMPEVILLEGSSGRVAHDRARRLGNVLLRPMVQFGVIVLSAFAAGAILAESLLSASVEFLLQLGSPVGDLFEDGGSLYAVWGALAVVPLLATARLLAYVGGRAQQDGWDIQLKFQAIRAREEQRA